VTRARKATSSLLLAIGFMTHLLRCLGVWQGGNCKLRADLRTAGNRLLAGRARGAWGILTRGAFPLCQVDRPPRPASRQRLQDATQRERSDDPCDRKRLELPGFRVVVQKARSNTPWWVPTQPGPDRPCGGDAGVEASWHPPLGPGCRASAGKIPLQSVALQVLRRVHASVGNREARQVSSFSSTGAPPPHEDRTRHARSRGPAPARRSRPEPGAWRVRRTYGNPNRRQLKVG